MVKRVGEVASQVAESLVVVVVSLLQVLQRRVSDVLQDEEGKSQQACSDQVTNLKHIRSGRVRSGQVIPR